MAKNELMNFFGIKPPIYLVKTLFTVFYLIKVLFT